MGCGASVHPSIYNETHKLNGIKPEKPLKMRVFGDPRHLRGDYTQLQYSRHTRNVHNKERQIKLFVAADEMSGRIIEEREMLSLGERSRGTSRNTSRATSPTQTKKTLQNSEEKKMAMTPVAESRATSNISNRRSDDMKEMDGVSVGDAKNTNKKVAKAKSKKKHKKANVNTPKVSDENPAHQDENDQLENDSKVVNVTDVKTKPKKTTGKQKAKHRKHKKHKKTKTNIVEELTDTEIRDDDDDDSDNDLTEKDLNETKVRDQSNSKGHSDETGNIAHPNGNPIILHDITNNDLNVPSDVNVPGSTNHVHFTDELTPHSRSSSVSELDSKRG